MITKDAMETLLKECDKEQLHLSGKIQPFAVLLGVDKQTLRVIYASENCEDFLHVRAAKVLGKRLHDLFEKLALGVELFMARTAKEPFMYEGVELEGTYFDVKYFDAHSHVMIECEYMQDNDHRNNDALQCGIDLLKPPYHLKELPHYYELLVKGIFDVTKYDRVMLYKFHEDWSGEVIGEMTKEGMGSYMGLHFPASDIPSIAREMYLKNPFRHIGDTQSEDVPIFSLDDTVPDLTYSDARSVSPVHLEYMRNMGMRGSFSTPIIVFGELWGLVACHNTQPCYLDVELRRTCRTLAHSFAIGISSFHTNEKLQKLDSTERHLNALMERVSHHESILDGLESIENALMQIVPCDGLSVVVNDQWLCIGDTLMHEDLERLDEWFCKSRQESTFVSDSIMNSVLCRHIGASNVAGVLATKTTSQKGKKIRCYWFRNELKQEIVWAGNPNKPVIEDAGALRLSPRRSFERWIEVKSGYAKTWSGIDTLSAMKLNKTMYRWL